jgi:hypothetical protein
MTDKRGKEGARVKPRIVFLLLFMAMRCSRNTIGPEEAKSDLTNTISFTAETELFLTFILNGSSRPRFTRGQAMYLEQEIEKLQKQLTRSRLQPAVAKKISECITQVEMLRRELVRVARNPEDRSELLASRATVRNIHETLKRISATL